MTGHVPPAEVLVFGSFTEAEASQNQSLSSLVKGQGSDQLVLGCVSKHTRSPEQSSDVKVAAEPYKSQEASTSSDGALSDIIFSSHQVHQPPGSFDAGSHLNSVNPPQPLGAPGGSSGDATSAGRPGHGDASEQSSTDKVITEVRQSGFAEEAQQVSAWGHGDRRHVTGAITEPQAVLNKSPAPNGQTSAWVSGTGEADLSLPPVVDKLPIVTSDSSQAQATQNSSNGQGLDEHPSGEDASLSSAGMPATTLTEEVTSRVSDSSSAPAAAAVAPPVAPAPVKKSPPASWAALLSGPALAPATTTPAAARKPAQAPAATTPVPLATSGVAPTPNAIAPNVSAPAALKPVKEIQVGQIPTDPGTSREPAQLQDGLPVRGSLGVRGPRGFVNPGNLCFANATLQALIGSSAFSHLLDDLYSSPGKQKEPCPTTSSFMAFWKRLHDSPASSKEPQQGQVPGGPSTPSAAIAQATSSREAQGAAADPRAPGGSHAAPQAGISYASLAKAAPSRNVGRLGPPLDPTAMFEPVLTKFSPQHHRNGVQIRQEDAQEFLCFLLDRMHDELLVSSGEDNCLQSDADGVETRGLSSDAEHHHHSDEGWETVGPKNKMAVTRKHDMAKSDISNIFFGELRSEVKTRGVKASATFQPFSVVQLDISRDDVRSVEDALTAFGLPELVEGYRPEEAAGSQATTASKVVKFKELPKVLVLHLMRFTYSSRGSVKLHKPMAFPFHLTLARDLVYAPAAASSPLAAPQGRTYKLIATVVHHGKEPNRGHYTADVLQPDGSWLRFDDANVLPVPTKTVAREQAYLLLYEKVET